MIHDVSRSQKSQDVRKYCNNIGTILRVLEENISCTKRAELYIGIIQEEIQKEIKKQQLTSILGSLYGEKSLYK